MVEDNQIKAQVSPFAIREGEIKTFDGKDGYVSMNQIVHKINIGHINEIHFAILVLVNEFEFITSRQLYQMLEIKGIDPKSQDKLNNKLDQLVKSKILTRYYFTSDEGKGIYRIYCLEKMGKYLLNSKEIECKWQPSDNTKPVAMIKKRLAGNQTIIAYLRKVKAFDSYTVKPAITAKVAGKLFKATGGAVKLTQNKKSIQFVFELIRREQDWQKELVVKGLKEDETVYIEYTKDDIIAGLKKENQELKKQLEVGKEQYNDLVEEKEKIQEQLSSNTLQFENQQKEFIEWLEDKINFWKDKIFENVITENDWTLTLWRNKLGILEESLSKYKEIIGVKDE